MKLALLGAALAAAAVALAPSAHATPAEDQRFYTLLDEYGLEPGPTSISHAQIACLDLALGYEYEAVLAAADALMPYVDGQDARNAFYAGVEAYCPWELGIEYA